MRIVNVFLMFMCSFAFGQYQTEINVAKDGSADFTSIQAAIDATKAFPDKPITININSGIYKEKVKIHSWNNNVTIIGRSPGEVIISWGDYFDEIDRGRNSTFHTATMLVQADNFRAENLVIENTAGKVGQAVALAVEADRSTFENCKLIGDQDTLYTDGANTRQHFINCHIEGTTDFIFGQATALFENCIIHSKANSYITAASTPQGRPYGMVFLNCKLTADEGINKVYLGRPWRQFAKTAFVNCELGSHIRPEGWHNWNDKDKEQTVFYAEGGNIGPGAGISKRVPWARQLSQQVIDVYTAEEILKPFKLPEMDLVQPKEGLVDISRDNSYTLKSALKKYRKYYPFIQPALYDPESILQKDVSYSNPNGRALSLDIFSVPGKSKSPKPVVFLVHGGGWSSGDRCLMYPMADYLAQHGYIAVTVEYRLSPEAKYPAAPDDIKNAVSWIIDHSAQYNVNSDKMVILGCSAGAQLAGLVGLTYHDDTNKKRFAAIVNIDGVMDFTGAEVLKSEDDPSRKETPASKWLGGRHHEIFEVWKEASPIYYVSEISPPILFINSSQPHFHAGRDEVIEKLNKFSIYSEVHTLDDAPHSFWLFHPWYSKTVMFIVPFLDKTLK